jgi:uncharacterized membrane protein YvbJ
MVCYKCGTETAPPHLFCQECGAKQTAGGKEEPKKQEPKKQEPKKQEPKKQASLRTMNEMYEETDNTCPM